MSIKFTSAGIFGIKMENTAPTANMHTANTNTNIVVSPTLLKNRFIIDPNFS